MLGYQPLDEKWKAGAGTGGNKLYLPVELQLQEFLVKYQLHQLVHAGHRPRKATQVGAYSDYADVLQVENIVVGLHQGSRQYSLAEVAQLYHQEHAVGNPGLLRLFVQFFHRAELGVQGNIGILHHFVEFIGVGRFEIPPFGLYAVFRHVYEVFHP